LKTPLLIVAAIMMVMFSIFTGIAYSDYQSQLFSLETTIIQVDNPVPPPFVQEGRFLTAHYNQGFQQATKETTLSSLIAIWRDGRTNEVVGLYAPEAFALPVVQQPSGNHLYVSGSPDKLTQFRRANQEGSIGILAHNYMAGQYFFDLQAGDELFLVYGDGRYEAYWVGKIADYQARSLSLYRDLSTQENLSDFDLFNLIYSGKGDKLVLQTCLEKDGNKSWGRRFIIAWRLPVREVLPPTWWAESFH
jgi:hypothetical protein